MIDQATQAVPHHHHVLRALSGGALDTVLTSATFIALPATAMMFDEDQPCMGLALRLPGSARMSSLAEPMRADVRSIAR